MDNFELLRRSVRRHIFLIVFLPYPFLAAAAWFAATHQFNAWVLGGTIAAVGLVIAVVVSRMSSNSVLEPMHTLWQAIVHLSPSEHGIAAPQVEKLKIGRELVASLVAQVYQFATIAEHGASQNAASSPHFDLIGTNLPLPCFVLDPSETIVYANQTAANYIGLAADQLIGKNVYMILDMSFPSEDTFDGWLKESKLKSATATGSWERVRLNVRDNHPTRLFDLAAYYNKDNPNKTETIMVLFDHTKQYSQDEQAVSFIALSVHELRTPLTLLRGYIEVFEEELEGKLEPELQSFMLKMHAMAEQLTAFVNNILNVARIDDDQLELHLQEATWSDILNKAIANLNLRAEIRGIQLECTVDPNLPTVGVDNISIQEVINNLVDNAIKYSGKSKLIKIQSHLSKDGLIETTIQDFGLGISSSIMPNLFTKFYRDHRNRAQIGGTGLGLYLSKAIVTAHGGNLWVRSSEGTGSTFGFTILPYSLIAEELKKSGDQHITRGAHGWIKNHSLYRR